MVKQTTASNESSSRIWNNLEEMVRMKVREFIQSLLEDEVTELLRRASQSGVELLDSPPVYRNGYGKETKADPGLWDHHGAPAQGKRAWRNVSRAGYCHCLSAGAKR